MEIKERAHAIVCALEQAYPDAECSLQSRSAHELLIATRLSAQCTDARVNIVTEALFSKYRSVEDFAGADVSDIERLIHSCGLYKTKARDIVKMAGALLSQYGGVVPDTVEELVKLPGVGRKTANLIVGDIYGKPSVVVDTHCIRITGRLGLVDSADPLKIERQLRILLEPEKSGAFCHRLVFHGRAVCKARTPECGSCCLRALCPYEG
jgi:endonuclease III